MQCVLVKLLIKTKPKTLFTIIKNKNQRHTLKNYEKRRKVSGEFINSDKISITKHFL